MTEKNTEKEETIEREDNPKILLITIGVIISVFLIFAAVKIFYKPTPLTLDDMFEKTLSGDETKNNYLYNGFAFVKAEGLWYTKVQGGKKLYTVPLHYGPKELEDIIIDGDVKKYILNVFYNHDGTVYLTFDPIGKNLNFIALAVGEFGVNVAKTLNLNLVASCTKNETAACETVPIVTCNNTEKPVIFFKDEVETRVYIKNNCLVFQGSERELVRGVDKVLLTWYNIIR